MLIDVESTKSGLNKAKHVFVLLPMPVSMELADLVQQRLFLTLIRPAAFVTHHHKSSSWTADSVKNVLPTRLPMETKPVAFVTKDTGKKTEDVFWTYVPKTRLGTEEDCNANVMSQESI